MLFFSGTTPHDVFDRSLLRTTGEMALTVADINRLEQAARVSMSGFQDIEASAMRSPRDSLPIPGLAAIGLAAVVVLAAAFQLV
ncbi:hypothetical protein [Mesorhizobium sp. L48C026A00]|uniref:hypothetical protein n=2 Tax=Phyllobacteriaceae TaxID=69277 RepID=UPI0018DB6171|nr:hypothetical protein [Mesorhizobium sp. L48C026A00]